MMEGPSETTYTEVGTSSSNTPEVAPPLTEISPVPETSSVPVETSVDVAAETTTSTETVDAVEATSGPLEPEYVPPYIAPVETSDPLLAGPLEPEDNSYTFPSEMSQTNADALQPEDLTPINQEIASATNAHEPTDSSAMETGLPITSEPPVEYDTVREALLQNTNDQTLRNHADALYRPGASTGDGGSAAALFHQKETGELVGGKPHDKKVAERETGLNNLLATEELDPTDREIAKDLAEDLKNAKEF